MHADCFSSAAQTLRWIAENWRDSVVCLAPEIGFGKCLGSFPYTTYANGILIVWRGQAVTGSSDGYRCPRSQSEAWRLRTGQP